MSKLSSASNNTMSCYSQMVVVIAQGLSPNCFVSLCLYCLPLLDSFLNYFIDWLSNFNNAFCSYFLLILPHLPHLRCANQKKLTMPKRICLVVPHATTTGRTPRWGGHPFILTHSGMQSILQHFSKIIMQHFTFIFKNVTQHSNQMKKDV